MVGKRIASRSAGAPAWYALAACKGEDTTLFFPDDADGGGRIVARARLICAGCEVKAECLAYAHRYFEVGVWGGTTTSERQAVRARQRHDQIITQRGDTA